MKGKGKKMYVVTGIPRDAQNAAAERGRVASAKRAADGRGYNNSTPQKAVREQVVGQIIKGRPAADEYAADLKAQGYKVSLRRWTAPRK